MNNITFIGRLTATPSITTVKDGNKIAQFVVAVPKSKTEADYFRCVTWDKQADIMEKYGFKGQKIGGSGSLHTRQYKNKKGENVNTWEIVLHTVDLLSFKDEEDNLKKEIQAEETVDTPPWEE